MDLLRSLILFVLPLATLAFHTGAPPEICGTMTPGHPFSPQTGESPYRAFMQKTTVAAGEPVDILLTSPTGGPPFKGFLVEVHPVNGDKAIGTFNPDSDDQAQGVACDGNANSAMTHKDLNLKTQVKLKWTAPGEGEYVPVVSWVKQLDTFWVKEKADKTITVGSADGASKPANGSAAEGASGGNSSDTNKTESTPDAHGGNHAVSSLKNGPVLWTAVILVSSTFILRRLF